MEPGKSNLSLHIRDQESICSDPRNLHVSVCFRGVIATGLVASPSKMLLCYGTDEHVGWFYEMGQGSFDARLLAAQAASVLFIVGWTLVTMMPFFIWLNYKGWFRADSLEELVGLDISYHGSMDFKEGGVKKEYVEAYKRHKGNIRERRSNRRDADTSWHNSGSEDPDMDPTAAAEEAMME